MDAFCKYQIQWVINGPADIRINLDSSGSSWSYFGTSNLAIDQNSPTMNYGWFTDSTSDDEFSRTILHEFGHALGCIHEHESPTANIPWNKPAVYAYYAATQGWSTAQVDMNIFDLYASSTTHFTAFDPTSIMEYPIPADLTLNGYSVGWNHYLSQADKTFIAYTYPREGSDVGSFNTLEVRDGSQPSLSLTAVKKQDLTRSFTNPHNVAIGLNSLDMGSGSNVRVKTYITDITTSSILTHIDTWGDTLLYSAGSTWLETTSPDPDFQTGTFNTQEDHPWSTPLASTTRRITFPRPFPNPPNIVIWLNHLDMVSGKGHRVNAYASSITSTGFIINPSTWSDTILFAAGATWIAYPTGKVGVCSGSFNTQDVRPWNTPQSHNQGKVNFPPAGVSSSSSSSSFTGSPRVLIGINTFDIGGTTNLRLSASASLVSKSGFVWNLDSWADTVMYTSGAQYIALAA